MIHRHLSGIKFWLLTRVFYSEKQRRMVVKLLIEDAMTIHVSSHQQFKHLFKTLPAILRCSKENVVLNPNYLWAHKYPYIFYSFAGGRIECWDYPHGRTVITYEEFWNTVFEKYPHINRHSLENLL